jgi:shikimate kinase
MLNSHRRQVLDRLDGQNIVLIGMPGAGKSTVGMGLSEELSMPLVDTDQLIESRWGCSLQEIIDFEGLGAFRRREEAEILDLEVDEHVIATGGSVVYSGKAMAHLRRMGWVVWLDVPIEGLEKRLRSGLDDRGIVKTPGQSLGDLLKERRPLYERYADHRVSTHGRSDREVVSRILDALPPDIATKRGSGGPCGEKTGE